MDFIDQVKQFSKRVASLKDNIQTEEATKTSLIMPFFSLLGYDVFNPDEFVPEYTADVGIKKGEKVDYALLIHDTKITTSNKLITFYHAHVYFAMFRGIVNSLYIIKPLTAHNSL